MNGTQTNHRYLTRQFFSFINMPPALQPILEEPLSRLLALHHIDHYYSSIQNTTNDDFLENVINVLNIRISAHTSDLDRIPEKGAAVIVANHPFGGIEGILMAALLQKKRPDFKILANQVLDVIPELQPYFIPVDVFKGKNSAVVNMKAIRKALEWVRKGHLLVVFPAGTVSHFQVKYGGVADPAWQTSVTRFIHKSKAPVIPVYFAGHNTLGFQVAGMVHPVLRTLRLPWELINKKGQSFEIAIGKPIAHHKLDGFKTIKEQTHYLRLKTYNLANRYRYKIRDFSNTSPDAETVAEELPSNNLLLEINQLPSKQILYRLKGNLVFYARAEQIPNVLHEIGRLRETAFRLVGEGSGRSLDLDKYDFYYTHLIAWDEKNNKIIGAYRLGLTDQILRKHGLQGLYTASLFHLKKAFVSSLHSAIEMGRSFVNPEYQRHPHSLFLLWRGIGAFVVAHPQYHKLFGMVTISNAYHPASQYLIMEYLKKKHWSEDWAAFVKGKNGHKLKLNFPPYFIDSLEQISELDGLIGDLEHELNGIPVLIRQYIKLGAEFMAFNRDEEFSDALDGLLVVDLLKTEPRLVKKYFGTQGQKDFYAYYGIRVDKP